MDIKDYSPLWQISPAKIHNRHGIPGLLFSNSLQSKEINFEYTTNKGYKFISIFSIDLFNNFWIAWCRAPSCCNIIFFFFLFFFYLGFLSHTKTSQDIRGRERLSLLFSTICTHSETFRHLFASFQLKWQLHILNHSTCNNQVSELAILIEW